MDTITVIKNFMDDNDIKYLLVNSTNEFLVEYNSPEENSRYKLTNFSGSTGEALVTPDRIYQFVDGRYHIQAAQEVNHEIVTVVKLKNNQSEQEEIIKLIPEHETLGVFAKKLSQKKYEFFKAKRNIKLLNTDPLDTEIQRKNNKDITLDISLTGLTPEEKIQKISQNLKSDECIYITDLDEVSYLYNKRNFSQNFSAKITARAIICKNKNTLYSGEGLKNLEHDLKNINKKVYIDKSSINAYEYRLLGNNAVEMKENPVQIMKAQKNDTELEHLKKAFQKTDNALKAVRDYIEKSSNISEFDIAQKLETEFIKQGAAGLSFKPIVAKDKNSALAHYSKSSKDEIITEGSLVLIDCGAYFDGGLATDITRVFVKGEPSELHKKIYTYVLKAFLLAYNYAKTNPQRPVSGYDIDYPVHKLFETFDLNGFVFNHGLGHGIGINVHEFPPKLSPHELSKTPLKEGMCFSIEPGLYKEGAFGVRLENSCYFKDNQIHSFVKMNYEKKLINFDMLTPQEKVQLEEFEVL